MTEITEAKFFEQFKPTKPIEGDEEDDGSPVRDIRKALTLRSFGRAAMRRTIRSSSAASISSTHGAIISLRCQCQRAKNTTI
jgi:hypothetical protein